MVRQPGSMTRFTAPVFRTRAQGCSNSIVPMCGKTSRLVRFLLRPVLPVRSRLNILAIEIFREISRPLGIGAYLAACKTAQQPGLTKNTDIQVSVRPEAHRRPGRPPPPPDPLRRDAAGE